MKAEIEQLQRMKEGIKAETTAKKPVKKVYQSKE